MKLKFGDGESIGARRAFDALEQRPAQRALLKLMNTTAPATAKEIGDTVCLKAATIRRSMLKLENAGLVERIRMSGNEIVWDLSPRGRAGFGSKRQTTADIEQLTLC